MSAITFIVLVLLLWILLELATVTVIKRSRTRWQHFIRVELTRQHFADARERLFNLVRAGKLDSRSQTFRAFYQIQTYILRRPDKYTEVRDVLRTSFILAIREG